MQQFATAIRIDPSYGEAYYELGKVQMKTGNTKDAIGNLERASQLKPDKSYVQYQLSQAYLKAGRSDAAQQALARYRDLKAHEGGASATGRADPPRQ